MHCRKLQYKNWLKIVVCIWHVYWWIICFLFQAIYRSDFLDSLNWQAGSKQNCSQPPRSSPCANCKTRSTSPLKAAICIRSGRRWWWSRSAKRWRSCRCIPLGIFSALGMCWCRRFCWGFAVKIMWIWHFLSKTDVSWDGFRAAEWQCAAASSAVSDVGTKPRADCAQYHRGEDSGEQAGASAADSQLRW